MQKGKYGICLWFYTVLAFILAFLGQVFLAGLLLGFVIVAERDEWLTRQVMQAFLLCLAASIINGAIDLFNIFDRVPVLNVIFGWTFGIIHWLVAVIVLIFVIIACVRTVKGGDASIPLAASIANRAFGYIKQKVSYQAYPDGYAAPGVPQQPGYTKQPGYTAPGAPQQPGYSEPQAPSPVPPQPPIPPQQPPQA